MHYEVTNTSTIEVLAQDSQAPLSYELYTFQLKKGNVEICSTVPSST